MTFFTIVAGICGVVEGLAGLVGTLFIFVCVDFPTMLIRDYPSDNHNWTHPSSLFNQQSDNLTMEKISLKPITILAAGYSKDPDREIIFCFSIMCSVFSFIWVISSLLIFIGSMLKSSRLLWLWVLATLAVAFLDFVGAIFFASKTGGYIMFFEDTRNHILSESTMSFLKYKYPVILLIVFSRGIVTVPINLLLAMFIHRTAENYYNKESKRFSIPHSVLAHSPSFVTPIKNGTLEPGPSKGFSSSAVYTNESFTPDEKY